MKIGDLVNFYTTAWVFKDTAREYKNPGVILSSFNQGERVVYTVMWADKRITREHSGYLQEAQK